MQDSEETIAAALALRGALKKALFIDTKAAAEIQAAIDEMIACRIIDAINAISDRIEAETGVRP